MKKWLQRWQHALLQRLQNTLPALTLRQRIAATMVALITVAGLLLALWVILASRRLEENVTYDLLSEELTHYEQRLRVDAGSEPLQSAQLRIYRSRDIRELPREIQRFAPGTYGPIDIHGHYLRVLVRDSEFGRLYITYDVTTQLHEQRIASGILAIGVVTTIVLTAWLAYGASGLLVDPVTRLANRLSDIDPRERQLRIAGEFANNELAPIAKSVDMFLERLDGFVEREQSFTATASHELRTPLAVIQGAIELLSAHTSDKPHTHKAIARIQRAVREMADFTDALLLLSREERSADNNDGVCNVTSLLSRVVEDQQSMTPDRRIVLQLEEQPLLVNAPDSMAAIVISNLLRNALQHCDASGVHCRLQSGELIVRNAGALDANQSLHVFQRGFTTRAGGHGMGLYLARRICERYGWRIRLENAAASELHDASVEARVRFVA
ncbi:MAG TPA: HAMP domain-containing sensor histidine kinase [Steroidobacteraceae bacterium]|nr:HAMP domain-containing sensor histidine kinase [Steroidobacteraceae bacterium]